ncbi:MAG: cytochrome c [Rhodocyclaceae bacterium]|jgi:cytochrome c556|nr:cytochrome c [Rhodocyclaceae bacterium]MBK9311137.1 cytochrome c [Rhodocyclaceae bacterium]MBK9956643.1 cytochrome c [Rhodocyclaceae bacterium]
MKKTTKTLLAGFALSVVAGTTLAQMKVEDAITFRQSGYKFMAWNMGKIKANVEGQYNKDQVAAAANVVAAIANSGMGALYIPGSDKGKGWHETNVKPELFTDKEGVGKVARAFNDAANEMARVAATGDAAAVKTQFGKLGETCKACHDKYRKEEH